MKLEFLLVVSFSIASLVGMAQNKTLGVGTASPNANAALHVESPTSNQGFIMPRLTTTQRNALGGVLVAGDAGLMLYDTDLKGIYIWDGTKWNTTAQVSGGPKLQYPYVDTVTSSSANSNLVRLVYQSNNVENVGVAHFENLNPNNGFSAIFGRTTSATNGVADFVVNNPSNNNDGIGVVTNGVGRAGSFTVNNATNTSYAVFGQSNGTALGAAIHGNNGGNGFGVFGKSVGTGFGSATVYGEHTGSGPAVYGKQIGDTDGHAGLFQLGDSTNTTGTGIAVFAAQYGLGRAGQFQINNTAYAEVAIRGVTLGTGRAGVFAINNATNSSAAIHATTNGTGGAAFFENTNTTAAGATGLTSRINTNTSGTAIDGQSFGQAGHGGAFIITNASNTFPTLNSISQGLGNAGNFTVTNASSISAALNVETNADLGFGIRSVSSGREVVGYFQTTNSSANSSTLLGMTNAPGGNGVGAINLANGRALSIFQGGLKGSTFTLSAGTTIATRAVAYHITGGGPYTFSLTPALTDGEMFFFYNDTASPVTVSGSAIPANSGLLFIVLGGTPRSF